MRCWEGCRACGRGVVHGRCTQCRRLVERTTCAGRGLHGGFCLKGPSFVQTEGYTTLLIPFIFPAGLLFWHCLQLACGLHTFSFNCVSVRYPLSWRVTCMSFAYMYKICSTYHIPCELSTTTDFLPYRYESDTSLSRFDNIPGRRACNGFGNGHQILLRS